MTVIFASPIRASRRTLACGLAGLALGTIGALAAAGAYTEATRVPDQP
jgi:hypothetical protein